MRVFVDANVLFSASRRGSAIARMLRLALEKSELVTSELASAEARKNLVLKRPDWLGEFEVLLGEMELVPSALFELPVELVDKDVPILCAAIRAGCGYLVTGDQRDFGHLFDQKVQGVTVITPLRLAEMLV